MKQRFISSGKKQSKARYGQRVARMLHVYTSLLMLIIMLFFTLTGLTLNHRDWLPDAPTPERVELVLPSMLSDSSVWRRSPIDHAEQVRRWLVEEHNLYGNQVSYDWQEDEQLMLIDVKRPGGYSLVEVLPAEGIVLLEHQYYGATSVLNDLHMGRNSGAIWSVFIDISALLMLLFTLTGFWLVIPQKKRRMRLFSLAAVGAFVMFLGYRAVLVF
ncbi:PepSY-associated TM helix domain-containing protein [Neptunomonas japonica]|uniref:PepSY-associated TM helix domain-containing protein n=1 Tax=Neptunomonas japonica TaxID=417574 RepID=UPI000426DF7B|nr:PepSY-associated TM helix domain-containing protein [Neptunomonas japonica]